jgi:hypothetical protein
MSYYPGLGSVNYGNAISQGLKNGADAYNQYSDDQRKRKQEEEDRALKKQQADLQFGNLTLQQKQLQQQQKDYEANAGLRERQRKVEITKLDEYESGAGTRKAQDDLNKQKIEFEKNRLTIEADEFDDEQRKKLDDMSEDFNMVATGQAPPELLMKKYKVKVEGLKQVDTGVVEGIINGERGYRIDHPNLKGRQDLAFSMLVGEKSIGLSDEQKKESAILISRALRGDPEAGATLASKYPQLNDVLQYHERFDPNAAPKARLAKIRENKDKYLLGLKNEEAPNPVTLQHFADEENKLSTEIKANMFKSRGGAPTDPNTKPNPTTTTNPNGYGNFNKPVANVSLSGEASPTPTNDVETSKWKDRKTKERDAEVGKQVYEKSGEALMIEVEKFHGKGKYLPSKEFEKYRKEVLAKLPKNPTMGQLTTAAREIASKAKPIDKPVAGVFRYR